MLALVLVAAVDLSAAEAALEEGHWEAAVAAFDTAAMTAPNDPELLRGRCAALSQLGRHAEAVQSCRAATKLDPTPPTELLLATVLVRAKTPGGLDDAKALVESLLARDASPDDEQRHRVRFLECEIALARHEAARFQGCVKALERRYPSSPEALYLAHLGAVSDGDLGRARTLLDEAKTLGLPDDMYATSIEQVEAAEPFFVRWAHRAWRALTTWGKRNR